MVRGITGAIQHGSGIVAGTVAVTAGTDAGAGGIMVDTATAAATYTDTPMPTADSVEDKPFAEARSMAVAASTVVEDFTAADGGKRQFC